MVKGKGNHKSSSKRNDDEPTVMVKSKKQRTTNLEDDILDKNENQVAKVSEENGSESKNQAGESSAGKNPEKSVSVFHQVIVFTVLFVVMVSVNKLLANFLMHYFHPENYQANVNADGGNDGIEKLRSSNEWDEFDNVPDDLFE